MYLYSDRNMITKKLLTEVFILKYFVNKQCHNMEQNIISCLYNI